MPVFDQKILILCKTYPSPSGKYAETSCVAGMLESGDLIRLFPVPFRHIAEEHQFRKWQWIDAKVEKARGDHRPESYSIKVDTILPGATVPTKKEWMARRDLLSKLKLFGSFNDIVSHQAETRSSLALLNPTRVLGLDIEPVSNPDWTDDEIAKLAQEQKQGGLFDEDKHSIRRLRKLPFDFYYRYECASQTGNVSFRHKLVDWEVGALFWNCKSNYGNMWEEKFRAKLEVAIPSNDLMFLMGNQHRFQDQWLLISLIYPPHAKQGLLL